MKGSVVMHILSGTSLPNIPWEDKPQACTEPIWRFSGNPIIGRHGNKRSNSVFNSAVVPFRDGFAGVFGREAMVRVYETDFLSR